jgi:hypothetical protein
MWNFVTFALQQIDRNGVVKEEELFATCSKHGIEKTRIKNFSSENLKVRGHL